MFLGLRHFDSIRGLDLKSKQKQTYYAAFDNVCGVFARVSVRCVFVKLAKSKSRVFLGMQRGMFLQFPQIILFFCQ